LLRAFTKGGFADLSRVHAWNQEFVATSVEGRRYEAVADDIEAAVRFMRACGIDLSREGSLHGVDFYTSHEALVLPYEQALTRFDAQSNEWFDCSAHLLWVGDRTRQIDGAHVEFLRGVANPIALKVGPTMTTGELLALCETLNPDNVPGRLTLISRLGRDRVDDLLPRFISALRDEGVSTLWACDPMHGNTFTAASGRKTRRFDDILEEVRLFFLVHRELDTWPGGLHIELTGEDVTECLGGALGVKEGDLEGNYSTMCDPRLNASQSLDLAFRVAEFLQG
jgi:3-deoxy-7-phosphoheptulonate synthase